MTRFLAGVADRALRVDRALTLDRAGAGEDRFEQRRLAALERAHQPSHRACVCHGPARRCSSATPGAKLSPTDVATETGCNATVLLEPPRRTFAPSPAATVTCPLAPK